MNRLTSAVRFSLIATCLLLAAGSAAGAELVVVDDVMFQDPQIVLPKYGPRFDLGLKALWTKTLELPDAELRRLAADTIVIAKDRGMTGLEDAEAQLRNVLETDDDPVVRRAAARALVTIDARSSAAALTAAAQQDGLLMAQIAEPALARWGDKPIRDAWLARLTDDTVQRGFLLLAIDGLAATRESRAAEELTRMMSDDLVPGELRLAAARSLGQLSETGLTAQAAELASRPSRPEFLGRLLAVNLLVRHSDEGAIELLRRLVADREPAVATAALARLRQIDVQLAISLAEGVLTSRDAGLRRLGVELLVQRGDVASVTSLGPLLDDRNPGIRRYIAAHFVEFAARDELRAEVFQQATTMLGADGWRGLEQAALVLGTLDHEPAQARLIELLPHPRGEAAVAAAWALRKLRVAETLPQMLSHAELTHGNMVSGTSPPHAGPQASQLLQAFGEMRYREAEPLMRKLVPKSALDERARGAAVWSLGLLHEKSPDAELAKAFGARLADVGSIPPEVDMVRLMAAISIGRMRAESEVPVLRKFAEPLHIIGVACGWSIEQITGEKQEIAPPQTYGFADWFLQPLQ